MIMPKPGGWAGSRDWYLPRIPCRCTRCHCNSGGGECIVPSKAYLDANGQCQQAKNINNKDEK